MKHTSAQYDAETEVCRNVYAAKMNDYGTAWRVLRLSSLTDQIFIKAQRIRSIQEKGSMAVDEGIAPEFIGIINYAVMALIQAELRPSLNEIHLEPERALELYDRFVEAAKGLMQKKNDDYSEAWRDMRVSSLTDIILMKLFRIKQIEDNQGRTAVSEGIEAGYYDIINYAVFALIKLRENQS
ncbi:MAG: DUF1599 domain-containing protein [Bacteroidales bacterium]